MAYQVLTLKYRPQSFDDLIGQPHIVKTLKNELSLKRIANAYLFAGPHGTGKTTTARLLAKALNCTNGPTPEPCNACNFCREIQLGNSLDLIEIDGASNRGIDEVRELREKIRYSPMRRNYKIYVIDEVHMLTKEAFNAFLKTLEEPPKHAVFVLATTAPYKIPDTITSRCQRFNFRKINLKNIADRIKYIANLESIEIEDQACLLLAQKVDGAVRDAISMLDQLSSYASGKIKENDVQTLLGIPTKNMLANLTDAIIKKEPSSIMLALQNILNQGIPAEQVILNLIDYFHNLFMIKTKIAPPSPQAEKQANLFKTQHLLTLLNFLFDTEKGIRNTPSPELYLEQALVRASMCSQLQIDELLANIDVGADSTCDKPPVEASSTPPVEADSTPPVEADSICDKSLSDIWNLILTRTTKENHPLGSVLLHSKPLKLTDNELFISCKNDFFQTRIETKMTLLESIAGEIIGRQIHIILEAEPSASRGEGPERSSSPLPKHKNLLEEPVVETAIKLFNAEPVLD